MLMLFYGRKITWTFVLLLLFFNLSHSFADETLEIQLPRNRLQTDQIGVVVNDKDPLSLRIGKYYIEARGIPEENLLHVSFQPGKKSISPKHFAQIRKSLLNETAKHIQAYAITWITPYRVSCMSITSAFTFGFDNSWCSEKICASTRNSPYYNYDGSTPYTDLSVRPTISIAAKNFDDAKALIDRGIASDGTLPKGTAYLMSTSDKQRNVRARDYLMTRNLMQRWIDTRIVRGDALRNRKDVLFYFTGKTHIDGLNTLTFLPGAIADHLTSTGGRLDGSKQMSALRWLEAGATGSYGTVVEPCNHLGKFPDPRLVIEHYSHGETLLEAYWKSVQQPGEGIFIGEPLAAPFDRIELRKSATGIVLITRNLKPGQYQLSHASNPIGPFKKLQTLRVKPHQDRFKLTATSSGYYRLEAL
ncbi:MAG: TIGR03790 family protein [Candidatus Thiodiazotropha sp. 6PLUC9]